MHIANWLIRSPIHNIVAGLEVLPNSLKNLHIDGTHNNTRSMYLYPEILVSFHRPHPQSMIVLKSPKNGNLALYKIELGLLYFKLLEGATLEGKLLCPRLIDEGLKWANLKVNRSSGLGWFCYTVMDTATDNNGYSVTS